MKIKKKLTALVCAAAMMLSQTTVSAFADGEHTHSFIGVVTKTATCAEEGEITYTCECGDSYTETIDKTSSHKYGVGEVLTKATCFNDGVVKFTCKVCGRSYNEIIPALTHNLDEGVVTKPATCVSKGIITYTCTLCGSTFDSETEIAPDAHQWDEGTVTSQPTCKNKGITTYTCTLCGTTKEEEIDRTDDHHWGDGIITTSPTCGKTGVRTYTCEICGNTRTEEVPATGKHFFGKGEVIKEADCTHAGLKHYVCSGCGLEVDTIIPKSAVHKFNSGNIIKTPTLTEKGSAVYTCTLCGKKLIKELPKLKDISKLSVTLSKSSYTYNGTARKPSVTVMDGSKKLVSGTDYTVFYSKNTNAGTAYVTVKGKGSYASSKKVSFTITAAKISGAEISGVNKTYTYTGKNIYPAPKVSFDSKTLGLGTDYTVTFSDNKEIGAAKITITGKGNYKGSKSVTFSILPKPTALSKLTSTAAGKMTVKWKKNATVTGYQIAYSTKSNFSSKTTFSVTGASKLSKTVKGLTSGKTYYVKVRCFKKVNGKRFYSSYSPVMTVKVK